MTTELGLYHKALRFFEAKDIEEGHKLLNDYLNSKPNNTNALWNMIRIYKTLKDNKNKILCYELLRANESTPEGLMKVIKRITTDLQTSKISVEDRRYLERLQKRVYNKYYGMGGNFSKKTNRILKEMDRKGQQKLPGLISGNRLRELQESVMQPSVETSIDLKSLPSVIQRWIKTKSHIIHHYRKERKHPGAMNKKVSEVISNEKLAKAVENKGIEYLFDYQVESYETITAKKHCCIVAPTGNGKTEAFTLPLLDRLLKNGHKTGVKILLIFPMKALAQDQKDKLVNLCETAGISIDIFDGDTTQYRRKKIFENPPDILITNPDIISYHLSNERDGKREQFQNLLKNVDTLVLDEIHVYTGFFGTNLCYILERLQRIIGKVQIIGASATIANPQEHMQTLIGEKPTIITCKQPRQPERHIFLVESSDESNNKYDSIINIIKRVKSSYKTLVFFNSHRGAEQFFYRARQEITGIGLHRAGLPKKYRKQIETDFKNGKLSVLIATPTLELGIDIGDLDAVITEPISINRALQRFGRAGRKAQESLAIVHLNKDDPVSEYYANNPEEYFSNLEHSIVNRDNLLVKENQLLLLLRDKPLSIHEPLYPSYKDCLFQLGVPGDGNENKIEYKKEEWIITEQGINQSKRYSIRGSNEKITIKVLQEEKKKILGERALPIALYELFPGAIYFMRGRMYKVIALYMAGHRGEAIVRKIKQYEAEITIPHAMTRSKILNIQNRRTNKNLEIGYGEMNVLINITNYIRMSTRGEPIGSRKLKEPVMYSFSTMGIIFRLPLDYCNDLTIHSMVHLFSNTLRSMGFNDVKIFGTIPNGHIIIYDNNRGGNGYAEILFSIMEQLLDRAFKIITQCKCKRPHGCPKCIQLQMCPQQNRGLDKKGAMEIIRYYLEKKNEKITIGGNFNNYQKTIT